jgi:processive 1,2-diacylglycerol beta-glucosyltransferase
MQEQPKILLITASFGNGHNQVSHALKHTFTEFGIGAVEIYNLYAEAYPYWNEGAKFLYKQAFTIGSSLYKLLFYGMDKVYRTKAGKLYCRIGEKKLEFIIRDKMRLYCSHTNLSGIFGCCFILIHPIYHLNPKNNKKA